MDNIVTIRIETKNDAFLQDYRGEFRKILEDAYEKIANQADLMFWLRDSNGNVVGHVKVESDDS